MLQRELVLLVLTLLNAADSQQGWWSQYGKAPTDGQIWYHTEVTGKLDEEDMSSYDGYIAVENCAHVGKEAIITVDGSAPLLVFIFDCASRIDGTRGWMHQNNIIGELGYYLTQDLNLPATGVRGTMIILDKGERDAILHGCRSGALNWGGCWANAPF